MQNNFRRYLIECLVSIVILCVLIFTCVFYVENKLLLFGIFIILGLSEKICIRFFAVKNIYSIIYKDLNPKLFLSTDDKKYFYLHPIYKSLGKMSIGEYQEAIDICIFKIKQNQKSKEAYLANLARIYFELDDIDALGKICQEFDISLKSNRNLIKKYPIFDFYRFYIDGKYNDCIDFCEQRLEKLKDKSSKYNLLKLNNYFNLTISYYKNNNIDAAIKWFHEIVSFAPKMYVAEISKKYLDRIENGKTSFEKLPEVIPDESYQLIEKSFFKKMKLLKMVAWAVIAVSLVLSVVLSVAFPNDSISNNTKYIEQLHDVIDVRYDDFKLLGYCNVKIDRKIVDVVALVKYENKIDVVSYVAYEDGTKAIEKRIVDIKPDITYSFESTTGTHQLYVSLMNNDDYSRELSKIEFEYNKKDMAFVVEQVATLD